MGKQPNIGYCLGVAILISLQITSTSSGNVRSNYARKRDTISQEQPGTMEDKSTDIFYSQQLSDTYLYLKNRDSVKNEHKQLTNSLILNRALGKSVYDVLAESVEGKTTLPVKQLLPIMSVLAQLSPGCTADLTATLGGILAQETWALRMVDAAGKIGSGILEGNVHWYGSYDECLNTVATSKSANNVTKKLFGTKYFLTSIGAGVTALQLGVCVPERCNSSDVTSLVMTVITKLNLGNVTVNSKERTPTFPLDASAVAVICILSIVLVLLVIGTAYDMLIYQPMLEIEKVQQENSGPNSGNATPTTEGTTSAIHTDEYTPLLATKASKLMSSSKDIGIIGQLFSKISLYSNAKKLLFTGVTSNSTLSCVHGVRLLSMTWVILGHTYFFGASNIQNILQFQKFLDRISFQAIINATVSVDTFFMISGLLVSYLIMKEMKEAGGPKKINWALYYFHRFWRLTPPYMLLLGAYTALFQYFGNGPAWPGAVPEPNCKTMWWTNLLYINNLWEPNKGCMMWSWYLANDMQFHILSPLFLVPLYLHFWVGLAVIMVVMLISFIVTGVLSVQYGFPPSTVSLFYEMDKLLGFFNKLYLVPWTRIGPYLVGILVGYALYRTERKVKMPKWLAALGWIVAAACNLAILYGLYNQSRGDPIDVHVAAFYNSVHRTAWACGVGWMIFACVTGYGGPVNTLLSWPALIPLSRLTFMAYLVHPIVMEWFYMSRRTPIYLDDAGVIYLFLGNLVMSYGLAFILSLAFEAPMMGLEKLIFKRR